MPAKGPSPPFVSLSLPSVAWQPSVNPLSFLGAGVRECAVLVARPLPTLTSPGGLSQTGAGVYCFFSQKSGFVLELGFPPLEALLRSSAAS